MSRNSNYRLQESIRQLTDIHGVFIDQFARALHLLRVELEADEVDPWQPLATSARKSIPHIDRARWAVLYRNRECYLGNTIPFRLLERLLRRPDRDVSHSQLLTDVWACTVSSDALRAAIKNLRQRLRNGDMADVADAIVGRTAGHYAFLVSRLK